MHNNVLIIGRPISIPHIAPLLHSLRHKPHRSTAKTITTPAIEIHEVTALIIELLHVLRFETPSRTQTITHIPTTAEFTATVCPATVE
jgi:hypothetical protein